MQEPNPNVPHLFCVSMGRLAGLLLVSILVVAPSYAQDENERLFRDSVDCGQEQEVRAYIEEYPNGTYIDEAIECLRNPGKVPISESLEDKPEGTTKQLFSLEVDVDPGRARVRILNIKPRYQPGIKLKPGRYRIEVGKSGYKTHVESIDIKDSDRLLNVSLEPDTAEGMSDSPAAGQTVRIAVVPFGWQGSDSSPREKLGSIIVSDLQLSGHFETISQEDFPSRPHDNLELDYSDWHRLKAEALVTDRVAHLAPSQYEVDFRLFDVTSKLQLGGFRTEVGQDSLRKIGHQIGDFVYEKLVGIPGVFSTQIAYVQQKTVGGEDVYLLEVSDYDAHNPKIVLESSKPISSLDWSPDGGRLSYVSLESSSHDIYIQELRTGSRKLVVASGGVDAGVAWSPDGDKLALALRRENETNIYLYDLASERRSQLTRDKADDRGPHWSPDGSAIVFASDRTGTMQIYRMDVNRKSVERVSKEGGYNASPSYSPTGDKLAFLTKRGEGRGVTVLDLSEGKAYNLTREPAVGRPDFSSNEDMIVFATQSDSSRALRMMSVDGRPALTLRGVGAITDMAWSPFFKSSPFQ